jgi:signal recognition particle receptor subunit beta
MALFNYTTKEITVKVVYYGPGLSGKTTNLQYLHHTINSGTKGKLVSLPTESDRTLFFDLLPINLGKIRDFTLRYQLYTVPGQVRYNATRKLVLKGADAVVFVADSQQEMREQNIESFKNMRENLIANNINPDVIPLILQYNKRDLPNILSIPELTKDLNENNRYKCIEAIAVDGTGVEDTFHYINKLAVEDLTCKIDQPHPKKTVKEPSPEEIPINLESVEAASEASTSASPGLEPTMYETVPVKNTKTEKTVEEGISKSVPAKSFATNSVIESTTSKPFEKEHKQHRVPEVQKESTPVVTEKKPSSQEETIGHQVALPSSLVRQLEEMNKNILDMLQMFKDLSRVMKETSEEQKVINAQLKDIRKTFETMKSKKRWFWFS